MDKINKQPPYRWKNKIVSKKVYYAMLQRVENGKMIRKRTTDSRVNEKKFIDLCDNLKTTVTENPSILQEEPQKIMNKLTAICDIVTNSANKVPLSMSEKKQNEVIKGNRIINISHLCEQLQCSFCKEPLLLQEI